MSPLLLQDCPGPPANGSLHGEPPVKVTLGYLTAVTGTMNNRQVNIVLNCLIDASTSNVLEVQRPYLRHSNVVTLLLVAFIKDTAD